MVKELSIIFTKSAFVRHKVNLPGSRMHFKPETGSTSYLNNILFCSSGMLTISETCFHQMTYLYFCLPDSYDFNPNHAVSSEENGYPGKKRFTSHE